MNTPDYNPVTHWMDPGNREARKALARYARSHRSKLSLIIAGRESAQRGWFVRRARYGPSGRKPVDGKRHLDRI